MDRASFILVELIRSFSFNLPPWISATVFGIFQRVHWTTWDSCDISVTCYNHRWSKHSPLETGWCWCRETRWCSQLLLLVAICVIINSWSRQPTWCHHSIRRPPTGRCVCWWTWIIWSYAFVVVCKSVAAPPIYTKTTLWRWRNFDLDTCVSRLENSELYCMSEQHFDPDMMAVCYDTVIIRLLDEPMTYVMIGERNHQPCFDNECRTARCKARRLEHKVKSQRNEVSHKAWRSSLCYSHHLARAKAASYWKAEIEAASRNSRHIWWIVDNLLGDAPCFSAEEFHNMLDKKVADIRASTASAVAPTYIDHHVPVMHHLEPVSVADVIAVIELSPTNQCSSDPLPTWLLKKCIEKLLPFITLPVNELISTRNVPAIWKHSIVTPRLKTIELDENVLSNFHPVSIYRSCRRF